MKESKYTVRDAYNHVFSRNYTYLTIKKPDMSKDRKNRLANIAAVKDAWTEFNVCNFLHEDIDTVQGSEHEKK